MHRRQFLGLAAVGLGWSMFPFSLAGAQSSPVWNRLPLRTPRQLQEWLPGGDGFQYVQSIVYSASDPRIVYLSVDQSGVWRSDDEGHSWEPKLKGFFAYGARSISVDPLNAEVVLAAGFLGFKADRARAYPKRHQGIYITENGGKDWRMVHPTDFFKQTSQGSLFVFDSRGQKSGRSRIVYCASASEGLLVSRDGGLSWRSAGFEGREVVDMAELPGRPGDLLIATTQGLFRFNNGSHESVGSGLPSWPRSIAVSPALPRLVYAAVGKAGIWRSTDGGQTFHFLHGFFPSVTVTDVAASPVDGSRVYARANLTGRPPYYSSDGGKTWHAPEKVDPEGLLDKPGFYFSSPFAPHPTDPMTCLHVTNGRARIIRTEDGGRTWRFSGNGFTGARMTDILFFPDGRMIFCLTDHGLWETTDNCASFAEIKIRRVNGAKSCASAAASGEHIVVGIGPWGNQKGLAVSHDGGETFGVFEDISDRFSFIAFHPSVPGLVFAGPYRSEDYGRSWERLTETVMAMSTDGTTVYGLRSEEAGKSRLLASTDEGQTFEPFGPVISLSPKQFTQVLALPRERLLMASRRGLVVVDRDKAMKRDERHGLARDHFGGLDVESLGFDPRNPDLVYAGRRAIGKGNGNGVFRSTDGGLTWSDYNLNLGQGMTVFAVKISPFDGSVYIGTSFGTFRYSA